MPPIVVRRQALADSLLDTIVELAYETLKRRDMHRRAGRVMPAMPNEDQARAFLRGHRRKRNLQDYELSESRSS